MQCRNAGSCQTSFNIIMQVLAGPIQKQHEQQTSAHYIHMYKQTLFSQHYNADCYTCKYYTTAATHCQTYWVLS